MMHVLRNLIRHKPIMSESLRAAFPEYIVSSSIGTGGIATIYRVSRRVDGKLFAVKMISRNVLSRKRLTPSDEYVNHSKVSDHPNILTLHGQRTDEEYIYYLMDYIPGGDLFACHKHIPLAITRSYVRQIADALGYCHKNGIIHNDVKLENVLVSEDRTTVYLADFGYSVGENQGRRQCGTMDYYCPCKARGRQYDNKTDIWSLGIMYHELLCDGETPFEPYSTSRTMYSVVNDPFEPGDNIESKDAEILSKMLCKSSSARPTAKEIVSMLDWSEFPN